MMMDTHGFGQEFQFHGTGQNLTMPGDWCGSSSQSQMNGANQVFHQETTANDIAPPRYVQHHYRDCSHILPPAGIDPNSFGTDSATFTVKLYDMLGRVDRDGFAHIISWQPHGRCFVIHKPELIDFILPKYFKFSKWSSFQRQLNLYGFKRITAGYDKGGYYHSKFLRGRAFLVSQITRIRLKGEGHRAKANPDQEPNFWNMPPIEELQVQQTSGSQNSTKSAEAKANDDNDHGNDNDDSSMKKASTMDGSSPVHETDQNLGSIYSHSGSPLEPTPIMEPAIQLSTRCGLQDCTSETQHAVIEWSRLFCDFD